MPLVLLDRESAAKVPPKGAHNTDAGRKTLTVRLRSATVWGSAAQAGMQGGMKTIAAVGMVAAALVLAQASWAHAQPPEWDQVIRSPKAAQTKKIQRAPTRIIVRPTLRNRPDATEFPRTDNLGYPGPNAVRQCVSWLATEHRPSGTVVVPRMRCWWARG